MYLLKSLNHTAITVVIPRSFPAPCVKSAIPVTINPIIISGIINAKYLLNSPEKVTAILIIGSGKINPAQIPSTIAISSRETRPILNLFIKFSPFIKKK